MGGIQLRADAPAQQDRSPTFRGCTVQLSNLSDPTGAATGTGTLGASVSTIFNEEFFFDGGAPVRQLGVPLTRIDFSGYGASTFSHWEAPKASIASTSQARFDVFVGRTAHEVIQVRSAALSLGCAGGADDYVVPRLERIHVSLRQRLAAGVRRPVQLRVRRQKEERPRSGRHVRRQAKPVRSASRRGARRVQGAEHPRDGVRCRRLSQV